MRIDPVEDYLLVSHGDGGDGGDGIDDDKAPPYLDEISEIVDAMSDAFWPVNKRIHDNPELAFKEFVAHDALTGFMKKQPGWNVTPSAYGMDTAWVAVLDSGRLGPVVSFNAEMGTSCIPCV